jgi:hypothetical protein
MDDKELASMFQIAQERLKIEPSMSMAASLLIIADRMVNGSRLSPNEQANENSALEILRDIYYDDDCSFDHNGNCQAHMWFGEEKCPHARATKLIEDIDLEDE